MTAPIRVRFAPSPTGHLHVGGARTALFNFLYARKMQGTFVLRVEDTDTARSSEESLKSILEDLAWLGISPDEGVTLNGEIGEHAPYRQSERLSLYQKVAQDLLDRGLAYYCFMDDASKTDDDAMMTENSPFRDFPVVDALARIAAGEKPTIRFKTPTEAKDYVLYDLVRNKVVFNSSVIKDFVLVRSSGMPTYNFACAVDDYLMKISHVIRAEEHLNNTVKQLMVLEALDATPPKYAHISLIMGKDAAGNTQKLSKRHGATSVSQFKDQGILPEALVNFMALLGWSSPNKEQELIPFADLQTLFSLKRINPAPAIFDFTKLRWMNSIYLRNLSITDLQARVQPLLNAALTWPTDPVWWESALVLLKPAVTTLPELANALQLLVPAPIPLTEAGAEVLKWPTTKAVLTAWSGLLQTGTDTISAADFETHLEAIKTQTGISGKELFWPLRVALIGDAHGPDIRAMVQLVARTEMLQRVQKTLAYI